MRFELLSIWLHSTGFGFTLLEFDTYRDDGMCYAFFGLSWDKEDKFLGIDIFWKYFEINFSPKTF